MHRGHAHHPGAIALARHHRRQHAAVPRVLERRARPGSSRRPRSTWSSPPCRATRRRSGSGGDGPDRSRSRSSRRRRGCRWSSPTTRRACAPATAAAPIMKPEEWSVAGVDAVLPVDRQPDLDVRIGEHDGGAIAGAPRHHRPAVRLGAAQPAIGAGAGSRQRQQRIDLDAAARCNRPLPRPPGRRRRRARAAAARGRWRRGRSRSAALAPGARP